MCEFFSSENRDWMDADWMSASCGRQNNKEKERRKERGKGFLFFQAQNHVTWLSQGNHRFLAERSPIVWGDDTHEVQLRKR